jgi:hypothetical protein
MAEFTLDLDCTWTGICNTEHGICRDYRIICEPCSKRVVCKCIQKSGGKSQHRLHLHSGVSASLASTLVSTAIGWNGADRRA